MDEDGERFTGSIQHPDSGLRPHQFLHQSFSTSGPVSQLHLRLPGQPFIPFFLFQFVPSTVHPTRVPISPHWAPSSDFFRGPPHQAAFLSSPPLATADHRTIRASKKRERGQYSTPLCSRFHSLSKASADLRTGSCFRFSGNGSLDTFTLLVRLLSRLYRFADHRVFEFSDSEMSRLILLWGFKRPGLLRISFSPFLCFIYIYISLFLS